MAKNKKTKNEAIALDVQLTKSEAFIEKHLKEILIAVAAIIIIVAGIFIWKNYQKSQAAEAAELIAKSQVAFAQEQYDQALNGDGVQDKGFLKIIDEYGSTPSGNLAKAYAGICYAKLNKIDEAIDMLESFSAKDDEMISPAAVAALGNCYVKKGDTNKGIDFLLKAAKQADNAAVSPVFLLQAAQLYESEGQADKAIELYQKIKDVYFRSPIAADIDKYIERATK